jgi:hypothetical protein
MICDIYVRHVNDTEPTLLGRGKPEEAIPLLKSWGIDDAHGASLTGGFIVLEGKAGFEVLYE